MLYRILDPLQAFPTGWGSSGNTVSMMQYGRALPVTRYCRQGGLTGYRSRSVANETARRSNKRRLVTQGKHSSLRESYTGTAADVTSGGLSARQYAILCV